MEYNSIKKEIILNRILSKLDKFVVDFVKHIDNYVIVSGYVSIVTGRSRATEDVDLLVPKLDFEDFKKIWNNLNNADFECINTLEIKTAFEMLNEYAIRFCKKGRAIPNIEFKLIKNDLDKYSYDNKLILKLKNKILFISPFEIQIAYKLYLGSEKDLEDAKHLYSLFKDKLNLNELMKLVKLLNVENKFNLVK